MRKPEKDPASMKLELERLLEDVRKNVREFFRRVREARELTEKSKTQFP